MSIFLISLEKEVEWYLFCQKRAKANFVQVKNIYVYIASIYYKLPNILKQPNPFYSI